MEWSLPKSVLNRRETGKGRGLRAQRVMGMRLKITHRTAQNFRSWPKAARQICTFPPI